VKEVNAVPLLNRKEVMSQLKTQSQSLEDLIWPAADGAVVLKSEVEKIAIQIRILVKLIDHLDKIENPEVGI
jgi:hypothetical protein